MSDDTIEFKDKGLQQLLKALSGDNMPFVKVGILGDKATRSADTGSNAFIGAMHEFGTSQLPQRSFLRMPLTNHLGQRLVDAGITDPEVMKQVIQNGKLIPFLKKISIVAQDTVLEAFSTGGYGEWEPSNMANKKVHQTLVETQQLRNSITAVVEE